MPVAASALSLPIAPLVWTPSMATPPLSGSGGGGMPRKRAQSRCGTRFRTICGSISTATSSSSPMKAGTAPAGNCATAFTSVSVSPILTMRVTGQPSRSTLLISTVSSAPRQEPMTRPRPPRMEAPPMMTAAMTMSSAFRPYWAVTPLSWKMAIRPASVAQ